MEQSLVNQVWQRAGSLCEYCRMPQQYDLLTFQREYFRLLAGNEPTRY